MFILSFDMEDESMVLEGGVVIRPVLSSEHAVEKCAPPPFFDETGFITEQKKTRLLS